MTLPQNTVSRWSTAYAALPIGGDGNSSCHLDHGRMLFVSGDSVPRYGGSQWARNIMTICDSNGLHVVRPNNPGWPNPYQMIPNEPPNDYNGDYHWLGPSMYHDGKIYSVAPHLSSAGGGMGVDLAVFNVPERGDPIFSALYPMPKWWSDAIIYDPIDKYVYWFGNSPEATDGWTGYDCYVARTPVDTILDQDWEFWCAGSGWSRQIALAAPFLTSAASGGTEIVYTVWHDTSGWHIVSRYGGTWGTLNGVPTISQWNNATGLTSGSWSRQDLVSGINADAYAIWYHRELKKITYNVMGSEATWLEYP